MKAVGVILAGGKNGRLKELTKVRATCAIPVASSYRAIDFSLSSMTNSGINKVAVITQFNSRSLSDHISSSKWWNFGRKNGGLFVFTPYSSDDSASYYRGTADSIYQNISFLRKSNENYVVICNGEAIYKMDFSKVIEEHVKKEADITIVYKVATDEELENYGILEVDENDRVSVFEEKPLEPFSNKFSLGIYVIKRTLLISLLEDLVEDNRYDFVRDVISRYQKRLKIYGYKFDGYWKTINSIPAYFNINMDFLNKDVREYFANSYFPIYTKSKDYPPVKYNGEADAKNCLIGNGTIINGKIRNSIVFRCVFTSNNSSVTDCILMENTHIGEGCVLENVIVDKNAVIGDGVVLKGKKDEPIIISKDAVIK